MPRRGGAAIGQSKDDDLAARSDRGPGGPSAEPVPPAASTTSWGRRRRSDGPRLLVVAEHSIGAEGHRQARLMLVPRDHRHLGRAESRAASTAQRPIAPAPMTETRRPSIRPFREADQPCLIPCSAEASGSARQASSRSRRGRHRHDAACRHDDRVGEAPDGQRRAAAARAGAPGEAGIAGAARAGEGGSSTTRSPGVSSVDGGAYPPTRPGTSCPCAPGSSLPPHRALGMSPVVEVRRADAARRDLHDDLVHRAGNSARSTSIRRRPRSEAARIIGPPTSSGRPPRPMGQRHHLLEEAVGHRIREARVRDEAGRHGVDVDARAPTPAPAPS